MLCHLKRNTRAQRPILLYDSAQDIICRKIETEGDQCAAFYAVNVQQQQLINNMAKKETRHHRSVQSIQWLWVSFVFHITCSNKDCRSTREVKSIYKLSQICIRGPFLSVNVVGDNLLTPPRMFSRDIL